MARRKLKLTPKREKWVQNRETKLLGEPMRPNDRQLERLAAESEKMVRKMHLDVDKALMAVFDSEIAKQSIPKNIKSSVAQDASIVSLAIRVLNESQRKWDKIFKEYAKTFSTRMTEQMLSATARDAKTSLEKLSGGLVIKTDTMSERTKDIIRASAEQSSSLIKTVEADYMSSVREAVMRSITDSSQSFTSLKQAVHSSLMDRYKVQKNKAKNVSLDQTRKVYSALTQSRMRDAGIESFQWVHSGGSQNPRSYHKNDLNGKVFKWDDPPVIDLKTGEKGYPGDAINCKCIAMPVIEFN